MLIALLNNTECTFADPAANILLAVLLNCPGCTFIDPEYK